jgi:titin
VTLAKADVGLGSVDDTADASKPVSTAQAAADAAVQAHAVQRANHSGTQPASSISDFAAEAAKYGPVVSVAGRTGAVSLAAADVAGLASVATSGSYTSLQNVPVTFAPAAHTHSTADITGITSSFAAASHTHDAAAIASGVLELARIPTIGYTALSGVPMSFSPSVHTHSTADVVGLTASFSQVGHTHSTSDIAGYTSLPAQAGKAGPLVTDGTAATWTTRYGVVDPVLVQGAGMTLTRDTAAGSITVAFAGGTSGIVVSSATPQPLGIASAGSSGNASRADHVHLMPSAADVGAAAAGHSHPYVQVLNGLTGTVSIAGGTGVTVSTASSSITISAGGGGGSANIVEAATAAGFPATGASQTLYHATDVKRIYFWDVTGVYVEAGPSGSEDIRWDYFKPAAPTGVTATAGNAQAVVSWTAPASVVPPLTDYAVQFSTDGGSTWTTASDAVSTGTSATITGLTNGTAHVFRVAGINGIGTGAYSTASAAVTPSSFTPASLANLAVWLDASDASSLYDATSGGSLVGSGGAVRRWQDLSGNGRHAVGSSGPTRSLAAVNGRDALSFSSSLLTNTGIDVSGGNQSLFMVVRFAASGFQISGGFGTGGSFGALLIESNRSSGSHSATFGGEGSEVQASGGSSSNVTKAFGAVLGSGTGSLLINGTSAGTVSRSTVSSSSGLSIGSYYGSLPLSGLICEVVYLARTVTAGEISDLQAYFAAKWGV